jgi:hypothetical protein
MILNKLKYKENIIASNRINVDNNYKDSNSRLILLFIYSKSLKHICLKKNAVKRTTNGLLLKVSEKNEE